MHSLAIPFCSTLILALAAALPESEATRTTPAPADAEVAAPRAPRRHLKIAVIDPRIARKKSKWAQGILAGIEKETQESSKELAKLQDQRQKLGKQLELWQKDSKDYQKIQLEISVINGRLQNSSQLFSRWRDQALAKALIEVRQKVQEKVNQLAKERGYDFVLQKTEIPQNATMDQKIAAMGQQVVLFAKPEYDITDDIVKLLDS